MGQDRGRRKARVASPALELYPRRATRRAGLGADAAAGYASGADRGSRTSLWRGARNGLPWAGAHAPGCGARGLPRRRAGTLVPLAAGAVWSWHRPLLHAAGRAMDPGRVGAGGGGRRGAYFRRAHQPPAPSHRGPACGQPRHRGGETAHGDDAGASAAAPYRAGRRGGIRRAGRAACQRWPARDRARGARWQARRRGNALPRARHHPRSQ